MTIDELKIIKLEKLLEEGINRRYIWIGDNMSYADILHSNFRYSIVIDFYKISIAKNAWNKYHLTVSNNSNSYVFTSKTLVKKIINLLGV